MANKLENFVIALANMDIAVMLRIDRFNNPFFTVVKADDVLPGVRDDDDGYSPVDLQQEMQSLMNPVAPSGSAIVSTVEDLQAQTRIKVQRARQAVSVTMDLLGHDLLQASLWMDIRAAQHPERKFGQAPTAAWVALRKAIPLRTNTDQMPTESNQMRAAAFVKAVPASTFYAARHPPANGGETEGGRF
ncbi:MAG TPA: aromatic amino acid lyase [Steroidobacteraceae bacterium]|nr:aromatic amino acid lyase [Steroidobacteraceae bacterium]